MGQLTYTTQEVQDRLDAVGTLVRPNLLDNAYFVGGGSQQGGGQFPINQRGATNYNTNASYTVDRWRFHDVTGGSVSLTSNGLYITSTSNWILRQIVEKPTDFSGKTVTLSMFVDSQGANSQIGINLNYIANGSESSNHSYTTVGQGGVIFKTVTIPNNCTRLWAVIEKSGSSASATIRAIKLELGDTQTLAHQDGGVWVLNEIPNFEVELAKCQRYFQNLNLAGSNYLALGFGTARSETRVDILTYLPVPLRTFPTISYTGNFNIARGTTSHWVSAMAVDVFFGASIKINCTTTGLTLGETLSLQVSGAGTLMLSADL